MGADGWVFCPNCEKIENDRVADLCKKIRDLYGVVSVEEYDTLVKETEIRNSPKKTLAEFYDMGVIAGHPSAEIVFGYEYSGSCRVCGFMLRKEYAENIKL